MAGMYWRTWTIIKYKTNARGEKEGYIYGSFSNRKKCEEYLNSKKEQYFFQTGNMEEAEKEWGIDNFIIDYSITLDRISMMEKFNVDLTDWSH